MYECQYRHNDFQDRVSRRRLLGYEFSGCGVVAAVALRRQLKSLGRGFAVPPTGPGTVGTPRGEPDTRLPRTEPPSGPRTTFCNGRHNIRHGAWTCTDDKNYNTISSSSSRCITELTT